ncbi:hypothetical protein EV356DRAFT_458005, partial [Viridothelium virens]
VFNLKININSKVVRFKAKWVAHRDKQRLGINYNKTYTAVIYLTIIKTILIIMAMEDLKCD